MKNFKHWAIQKLLKWSKILDIEKALRDKYHEGVEATEKKYAGKVNVWWDPTVRSYPQPPALHLPTGQWSKMWYATHPAKPEPVIRTNTEPIDPTTDFPEWLNSEQAAKMDDREWANWLKSKPPVSVEHMTPAEIERVPTIRDLTPAFDPENTDEVPAIMKLYYQERQARHAG